MCHCVCMYTVHLSNQIKRDWFSVFNHPKLDKAAFRIKQLTKINIHNFYNFNLQLKLGLVSLTTYCLSNLHNSEMLSKCRQTFSFCVRYFQKPSHSSRGQTSSTGKLKDNFSEKCFSNVMQWNTLHLSSDFNSIKLIFSHLYAKFDCQHWIQHSVLKIQPGKCILNDLTLGVKTRWLPFWKDLIIALEGAQQFWIGHFYGEKITLYLQRAPKKKHRAACVPWVSWRPAVC